MPPFSSFHIPRQRNHRHFEAIWLRLSCKCVPLCFGSSQAPGRTVRTPCHGMWGLRSDWDCSAPPERHAGHGTVGQRQSPARRAILSSSCVGSFACSFVSQDRAVRVLASMDRKWCDMPASFVTDGTPAALRSWNVAQGALRHPVTLERPVSRGIAGWHKVGAEPGLRAVCMETVHAILAANRIAVTPKPEQFAANA